MISLQIIQSVDNYFCVDHGMVVRLDVLKHTRYYRLLDDTHTIYWLIYSSQNSFGIDVLLLPIDLSYVLV